MSVQNLCTPENIFGPFRQTLFLGCSVMGFTANVGWNEQISELSVSLVEDTCAVPSGLPAKVYYDTDLVEQEWTAADPGFYSFGDGNDAPPMGCPVYFRIGDFEFSGIFQSFVEKNSESGRPTYEVRITDPREILQGTSLIIGDYAGTVGGVPNCINVFGFLESYGSECPLSSINGAILGSPAGGFGGSLANDNGIQWNKLKDGTRVLLSAMPAETNDWSPFGRMVFKGSQVSGFGVMPYDAVVGGAYSSYYLVDLSDVPDAPEYWRIEGTSVPLLDAVAQLCEDASYDFFIELIFVEDIGKVIKVRTVTRRTQPDLTGIATFATSEGVLSSSAGRELRNDKTNVFVVGGNIRSMYQLDDSADVDIVQYWGLDASGDVQPTQTETIGTYVRRYFVADTGLINASILSYTLPGTVEITTDELDAALISYDSWASWVDATDGDLKGPLELTGLLDIGNLLGNAAVADVTKMQDLIQVKPGVWFGGADDQKTKDRHVVYEWVRRYATEYYGRKYAVKLPYVCVKYDDESGNLVFSDKPAQSGWSDDTVLELANPGDFLQFFQEEDSSIQCFVRWPLGTATPEQLDMLGFSPEDCGIAGDYLYMRASVEDGLVFEDAEELTGPMAIINVAQPMPRYNDKMQVGLELIGRLIGRAMQVDGSSAATADAASQERQEALTNGIGRETGHFAMTGPFLTPYSVALPMESTINVYGPWYAGTGTGRVNVVRDPGLVPWEYGGTDVMILAGQSQATEGISLQNTAERGEVVVAGYPTTRLGYALGNNPTFTGTSVPIIINGSGSFTYAEATADAVGNGTNVTGVNVQVSAQGITTTYTMSTFTSREGRFYKGNAERLKQIGRVRTEFRKKTMANQRLQSAYARKAFYQRQLPPSPNDAAGRDRKTPHDVFVGEVSPWFKNKNTPNDDVYRRTTIATKKLSEANNEINTPAYETKAIMSFDGLLRPVSLASISGLPCLISDVGTTDDAFKNPVSPLPPMSTNGTPTNNYNKNFIYSRYLNPFTNPSGLDFGEIHGVYSNLSHGHDISMVGRPTGTGMNSLSMYSSATGLDMTADYQDSYRFLALKGPIVLQSWGYDIDGKPVPNAADVEANCQNGIFRANSPSGTGIGTGGLRDQFLDGFLRKSHTWPVAPIDLRLDRKRGVWVSPPAYKICTGKILVQSGSSYDVEVTVDSAESISDANGNVLGTATKPVIYGAIDMVASTGTNERYAVGETVMVYYDVNTSSAQIIHGAGITPTTCGLNNRIRIVTSISDFKYGLGLDDAGCLVMIATSGCA